MPSRRLLSIGAAMALVLAAATAEPAAAAYPGTNGLIQYAQAPYEASAKATAYTGPADLFTIDPAQPANVERLTTSKANESAPIAAPGGSSLAYESFTRSGSRANGVAVENAATRAVTRVLVLDDAFGIAWTPDGRDLAIGSVDDGIWVLPAAGTSPPKLIVKSSRKSSAISPTFTPDGLTVLFSRVLYGKGGELTSEIWSAKPDGSAQRKLVGGKGSLGIAAQPDVSPDGTRIAFVAEAAGGTIRSALYLANVDGTGVRRLAAARGRLGYSHPSWAPEGNAIAVARFGETAKAGSELDTIDVATGAVTVLERASKSVISAPSWSAAPLPGGATP